MRTLTIYAAYVESTCVVRNGCSITVSNMANIHIHSSLQQLANDFVQGVLQALTSASLTELSQLAGSSGSGKRGPSPSSAGAASFPTVRRGPGRPRGSSSAAVVPTRGRGRPARVEAAAAVPRGRSRGRRQRRSSEDVGRLSEDVTSFVRNAGGGVAVSDIAKGIGLGTAEITRPVAIALLEGKIYKEGEKRLTRYFATGEGSEKKRGRKKLSHSACRLRAERNGSAAVLTTLLLLRGGRKSYLSSSTDRSFLGRSYCL